LNLRCHEEDFHVAAEWNFFATSHGKSPCDAIGGTVKQLIACVSLQTTVKKHTLTPEDLNKWAKENITGITLFCITEKIKAHVLRPTGCNMLKLCLVYGATTSLCSSTLQSLRRVCCLQVKTIWVPK
jgi:hypothetical protein